MFSGYLKFADRCTVCEADFSVADAGDGPAVFVIFVAGLIVAPLLFVLQFAVKLPGWLTLSITLAVAAALCVWMLPLFKGVLFALQWTHKAREVVPADLERDDPVN